MTTHLVQFSTGLSSAEVAWRLVEAHGASAVVCLSADTREEHPDNWRFGEEVIARLGCEWIVLADGRTPMEVGRDAKCVPNNRMAVCSKILKRELLRRYMDEHYSPAEAVTYIGYDWSEPHRIESAARFWAPWAMKAPLAEPPYASPLQLLFRHRGIEPPELYRYGFAHANCGGACVRAGQAPWALLLQVDRSRYLRWEAEEERTRSELGKDVAILRDRTGGTVRPLPLAEFRRRFDDQDSLFGDAELLRDLYDVTDVGACGCDMDSPDDEGDAGAQACERRPPSIRRKHGSAPWE